MLPTAKNLNFLLTLLFTASIFFSSCSDKGKDDEPGDKAYSIYILGKDGREWITPADSLSGGIIYPERQGAPLNIREIDRDIIVRNGFYYRLNWKNKRFYKYRLAGGAFEKTDSVTLKDFSIENFRWLGGDTLLLTGLKTPDFAEVRYFLLKASDLTLISQGSMDIARPSGRFSSMSIGFAEPKGDKLLLGYTYHQQLGGSDYTTSDTTYITALKYPEMSALETQKEFRSTYPAGINTVQSYTFYDEQGDFYFMSCPGIALGNRPDVHTGIFRIRKNALQTDPDYFFDISASRINNHAYGLWYLGNGQAIIRSERKDLYKGLGDHYSTAHFEFYLLDLKAQTVKKLDLPLDKGTRRECVIVDKGIAYIAVNSTKEGNFVWLYDISKGTLRKGLQLAGETDFIMRIDRLH